MNKQQNNCYFKTDTRPQIGDIVQTGRCGQGVIISLLDKDTLFSFFNTQDGKIYTDYVSDSDLIERPKELTEVIFRYFKGGSQPLIALFPDIAANLNINYCDSYSKNGEHGAASVSIIGATIPAPIQNDDVRELFLTLTRRGYFLKVITRFSNKHRIERQKQIV